MPQLEVTLGERKAYPTYETAARIFAGNDLTAPVEFVGWTALRGLLIAPGLAMAGVRGRPLILGAILGSTMVSLAALWRSYATKQRHVWEQRRALTGARSRKPLLERRR